MFSKSQCVELSAPPYQTEEVDSDSTYLPLTVPSWHPSPGRLTPVQTLTRDTNDTPDGQVGQRATCDPSDPEGEVQYIDRCFCYFVYPIYIINTCEHYHLYDGGGFTTGLCLLSQVFLIIWQLTQWAALVPRKPPAVSLWSYSVFIPAPVELFTPSQFTVRNSLTWTCLTKQTCCCPVVAICFSLISIYSSVFSLVFALLCESSW